MKTKKILAAIAALTIVCGAVPTQPFADVIGNMAITANAETSDYEVIKEGYFTYNVYSDHTEVATYKNYNQVAVELKSEINGVPLAALFEQELTLFDGRFCNHKIFIK